MQILCSWVGRADLDAEANGQVGPILAALRARPFREAHLLTNWPTHEVERFKAWLGNKSSGVRICMHPVYLSQPNAFSEIYNCVTALLEEVSTAHAQPELSFYLSPGTPVMASVWLLLATSRFPAQLIESSVGTVKTVDTPFNLPAQILPDLLRHPDRRLTASSAERPTEASSFGEISYQSEVMAGVVRLARKAAPRNVPLLIEGESGTGKELFARAVHQASPRANQKLVVVNCGAIPANLVESRLFGHLKGAFTGATSDVLGCFEEANGGTLFLDEVGELSLSAQVALLRVLQEGEVTRVGENKTRKVDVRVIAATNRDLFTETVELRFREDLFYRLAVLRLRLPALRERTDDIDILINTILNRINKELADDPLYSKKSLSINARQLLVQQSWRGNIRELQNTLRRALVWSDSDEIDLLEIKAALFPDPTKARPDDLLNLPLGSSFSLDDTLDKIAGIYIQRALEAAGGNKSRAARMIGYASYQRLDAQRQKIGL